MRTTDKTKGNLSPKEIDNIVVAQANDDAAWEKPIRVRRKKPATWYIPGELVRRVAFLAQLHRQPTVEAWLIQVIQERVDLEEAAFLGVKREFATRNGA